MTLLSLSVDSVSAQPLPPPRDGEIRAVFWELQNRTDVWLTLEPQTTSRTPAPTAMLLTLTCSFPGKFPKAPPQNVELRALPGMMWAPLVQLSVVIDGASVDLPPLATAGVGDGGFDYIWVPLSVSILKQIADARRVTINALRLDLELTDSQRTAIGVYLERILSDNPGQFKR
jgi:hypothetical protein